MTLPSSWDAAVLLTGPFNVEQRERQVCVHKNEGAAPAGFQFCLEATCDPANKEIGISCSYNIVAEGVSACSRQNWLFPAKLLPTT